MGPGHKVDLHGYDLLIFVEIYKVQDAVRSCTPVIRRVSSILTDTDEIQNIIGMSVVGADFDKLKRYNIEELRQGPSEQVTEAKAPSTSTESI